MTEPSATPCPGCERLQTQLERLQATVARLQEQLVAARKDSSTSSKPPSSDIVKPPLAPPPPGQTKRNPGGQPGHPRHQRVPFPAEQVQHSFTHTRNACPCCGGPLRLNGTLQQVVQQVDVEPARLTVQEHTRPEYWCDACVKPCWADLPKPIAIGGLVGPRLTALIAYLKGACHASFSTIRKFLRDVVQVTLSRGQLSKIIAKVAEALDGPYRDLLGALPDEAGLNVDETGHKDRGRRMWTWCFRADLYTLFKIDPTRSGDVLIKVLGKEFDGVLGCDYFSAYRRYTRECGVRLQFCLAHLIRDVKFLMGLPGVAEQAYGRRLRDSLADLFGVIHRRESLPAGEFRDRLEAARDAVLRSGQQDVPTSRHAQAMARRLRTHGVSYFTFVTTPGLEPTNNLAEQAIRFLVIDRLITQGTRSETGRRWCERIWTVMATCAQQGRGVLEYLDGVVRAYFGDGEVPSLLPGVAEG